MPGHSTESWAGTGQPPPAGRRSPEPASCRSLSLGISAGCPKRKKSVRWLMSIVNICGSILWKYQLQHLVFSSYIMLLQGKQFFKSFCMMSNLIIRALTLADARWLGSSLDWSAPTPRFGSCVWKTDMRPPVGDSSLKAACRAEPRADWVSMVFSNKLGRLFSRSCTSWKTNTGSGLFL